MTICCECGKELDDMRGAKGHAKFSGPDDVHGEEGEVPDNWRSLFDSVEESPVDDESEPEDDSDNGSNEDDPDPSQSEESNTNDDSGESGGTLRRLLGSFDRPFHRLIYDNGE